ncbi:DNA-processing protein DprA [Spongiactinospora rosea]|nr:DNA-processing protein DprA [Spongiactinospora rosea]
MTITGSRATDHRRSDEYWAIFNTYLGPFARAGVAIYLGGASGIDSLALLWLSSETQASLIVATPGTLADQPADARRAVALARERDRLSELVELRHPRHPSTESYHARNRWMVDRSDFVLGFPKGPSGGTWYTLNYAAERNKPRLIHPI